MNKFFAFILVFFLFMPRFCYSQPSGEILEVTEEDFDPSVFPYQVRFPNGSLTDNNDDTVSINTLTTEADPLAIHKDGTSIPTASISFDEGLSVGTTKNVTVGSIQWTSTTTDLINADSIEDGSTNAIPTLTQESNWDTHLSSDGSDHAFIDQSVIIGATPSFGSLTLTNNPSVISSANAIDFKPSGEGTQYLQLTSLEDLISQIELKGASALWLKSDDENWVTLGFVDGAGGHSNNQAFIGWRNDDDYFIVYSIEGPLRLAASGDFDDYLELTTVSGECFLKFTGDDGYITSDGDIYIWDNNLHLNSDKYLQFGGSGLIKTLNSDLYIEQATDTKSIIFRGDYPLTEYFRVDTDTDNVVFTKDLISTALVQAEQVTSTGDITMQGHLLTMGDIGVATDIVMSFLGLTNSGSITFDESANEFDFGDSLLTTTELGTFGNLDVDTLNLNSNIISDSTGAISFDNDNLTTTGTIDTGIATVDGVDLQDDQKIILGTGNDGEIFVFSDHLNIKNVTQDMDIILGINDGGVAKTITWDADVDKLKHSNGTFDFDDDNLITTGDIRITADNSQLEIGALSNGDLTLIHDGVDSKITNNTGDLRLENKTSNEDIIFEFNDGGSTKSIIIDASQNAIDLGTASIGRIDSGTINSTANWLVYKETGSLSTPIKIDQTITGSAISLGGPLIFNFIEQRSPTFGSITANVATIDGKYNTNANVGATINGIDITLGVSNTIDISRSKTYNFNAIDVDWHNAGAGNTLTNSTYNFKGINMIDPVGYADATVTVNKYMIDIGASTEGGTVNDNYGIRMGDFSGATNNYAIKTGLGDVQFGDRVINASLTQTAAGPTDNLDVGGVNIIFIDTSSNNVIIGGFINGVDGQILHIVVEDATNNATLEHAEATGNQDIYLSSGADETLTASYGGWTLVCNGTHWYEGG